MVQWIAERRVIQGILMMLLAVALYSVNDALLKWLGSEYNPMQVVFCRSFFSFVPLAGFLLDKSNVRLLRTQMPGMHLFRGLVSFVAVTFFIYAFAALPLADAYAIIFIGPLCMALFSGLILGEKVHKHAWGAILVGFTSVLFMMRPGEDVFSFGGVAAGIAGITYALSLVLSRYLSRTESNFSISLWFNTVALFGSLLFMPFVWIDPPLLDWCLFVALGVLGGAAQMAITHAFKLAPAYIVGPLDYLILVFGAGLGYTIWGDVPETVTMIGAAVLIGCGLFLVYLGAHQEHTSKPAPATPKSH